MPLIKGKSKKSFEKNVETEMDEGKPKDQSLAIAYSLKRAASKKMAEGGMVMNDIDGLSDKKNSIVDMIIERRHSLASQMHDDAIEDDAMNDEEDDTFSYEPEEIVDEKEERRKLISEILSGKKHSY